MDVANNLLVVGTAERHVVIINTTQPTQINKAGFSAMYRHSYSISFLPYIDRVIASQIPDSFDRVYAPRKWLRYRLH